MENEIPFVAEVNVPLEEGKILNIATALTAMAASLTGALKAQDLNPEELFQQIARHEGYKQTVYKDSMGIPTIGIGFNLNEKHNQEILRKLGIDINEVLSGKPLTDKQIRILYNFSLKSAYKDAESLVKNFKQQPKEVKKILIDMAFNLGKPRLSKFKGMLNAVERGDYKKAALEMMYTNGKSGATTPWYNQTKGRAKTLVSQMANVS